MNLLNFSRYPTPEVRKLVTFGMDGLDHDGVQVYVLDHPSEAAEGLTTAKYDGVKKPNPIVEWIRVQLAIGAPHMFPHDNIVTAPFHPEYHGKPYGGHWENYIKAHTWEEGLVHLAAHEGRHAHLGKRYPQPDNFEVEAEAEAYAKTIVEKYRKLKGVK